MKKKKSLLTKRLYFAIAVLTLLIAAGVMTTAFTFPTPGSPTHQTLFTDLIASMIGSNGKVTIDSSVIVNKNITATGGGTGYVGMLATNSEGVYGRSVSGAEGRLGFGTYGVYTPNALSAGSIQTGALTATSLSTGTLSMSGDLSAKSLTTTGYNPNGYGIYSPSYPISGAYFSGGYYAGGPFYGSSISTGSIYSSNTITASGGCECSTVNANDWVQANKGFMANGAYGVGSASATFTDTQNIKHTITVTKGIVTGFT